MRTKFQYNNNFKKMFIIVILSLLLQLLCVQAVPAMEPSPVPNNPNSNSSVNPVIGMVVSNQTTSVAGISLSVNGIEELRKAVGPNSTLNEIGVVFILHGRGGTQADMKNLSDTILSSSVAGKTIPLVTVTYDLRNHGSRLVNMTQNYAWLQKSVSASKDAIINSNHASDLYSMQLGNAFDALLLMELLPTYLRNLLAVSPEAKDVTFKWGIVGRSLGGHSTLLAILNDLNHRIDMAIPIISCGDFQSLMNHRYSKLPKALQEKHPFPTLFPASLSSVISQYDPVNRVSQFISKENSKSPKLPSILHLYGGRDNLVPKNTSAIYLERMQKLYQDNQSPDKMAIWVDENVGHDLSDPMVGRVTDWIELWWGAKKVAKTK